MHPVYSSAAVGTCTPHTPLGLWVLSLCVSLQPRVNPPHTLPHSCGCVHHACSSTDVDDSTLCSSPQLYVHAPRVLLHGCGHSQPAQFSVTVSAYITCAPPQLWAIPPHVLLHSWRCSHPVHPSTAVGACSSVAGVIPPQTLLPDWVSVLATRALPHLYVHTRCVALH